MRKRLLQTWNKNFTVSSVECSAQIKKTEPSDMIIVDIATEHAEVQSQLSGRVDMPTPYSVASNHSTVDIILLS